MVWRSPRLSEFTPTVFNMQLTHLGSEATIDEHTIHLEINRIKNSQHLLLCSCLITKTFYF